MSLPTRAAEKERKSSEAGGAGVRAARQVRSSDGARGAGSAGASHSSGAKGARAAASPAVLKFKTNFRNTIYDTLLRRGWKETCVRRRLSSRSLWLGGSAS